MVRVVPAEEKTTSSHRRKSKLRHLSRKSRKTATGLGSSEFSVTSVSSSESSESRPGRRHKSRSRGRGVAISWVPDGSEDPEVAPQSSAQDGENEGKVIPPVPVNLLQQPRASRDARNRDNHTGVNLLDVERHLTTSFAWLETERVVFLNTFFDITDEYEEHQVMGNRYAILDSTGQVRFFVYLKIPICSRFICFYRTTFIAQVYGADDGVHVFDVVGPTTFLHINISATKILLPNGDAFGKIMNSYAVFCRADYVVYNANKESMFKARGSRVCPNLNDDFTLSLTKTNDRVGIISRTWKSTTHQIYAFLDVDTTGFSVTPTIEPRQKALLIGLIILIEFQWYNRSTRFAEVVVPAGIFIVIVIFLMLWFPSLYFRDYFNG